MRPRRLPRSAAVLAAAWVGAAWIGPGPAQAEEQTTGAAPSGRVVVLGIDGLQWSDVTQGGMPTLFDLVGHSDIASLVTRGPADSTCPADGWLTLNTGSRTTGGDVTQYPVGTSPETALITEPQLYCAPLPEAPQSTGSYDIPNFSTYTAANDAFSYSPVFGSLTAPVAAAGGCVAASGAGALLGAADANGHVSDYLGAPGGLTGADLSKCALTLVDLGGIIDVPSTTVPPSPTPPTERADRYSMFDAEAAALLNRLPSDTTVVVAGLNDSTFDAQLHAVLVTGAVPSGTAANGTVFDGKRLLYTSSTRHPGLVQTLDLTPSLLHWIGLTPQQISAANSKPFTGAVIGTTGTAPSDPATAIVAQAQLNTANQTFAQTNARFITWMARAVTILVWSAGTVFLAVRWLPERYSPGRFVHRLPLLGRWRTAVLWAIGAWATLLAAVAPASFLANFTHWPAAGSPGTFLFVTISVISVVLAAATLAACRFVRPLRRQPLAPAGLLGLLTLAIIAVDVATGSRLQAQTPFGLSYVIAGRFYGIGNSAVGVYCASAMIGSAWLASVLMPRRGPGEIAPHEWPRTWREAAAGWLRRAVPGRLGLTRLPDASRAERRRALLTVGGVGLAAVAACGYPSWGSKFGGTIAMVPGFVLLLFLVAGLRITWRKVLIVAVSGIVVVSGFAAVNYLQPAGQRSHFGNFVASLFDGTWTTTIHRKIDTNLGSINNDWFSHYVPWILFWSLLAILVPRLIASRSLALVYAREPFVRCALWLALITVTIGWFVDDSGILVPKMAVFLAIPLAVLSATMTLLPDTVTSGKPAPDTESVAGGPVALGVKDQGGGPDEAGLLA